MKTSNCSSKSVLNQNQQSKQITTTVLHNEMSRRPQTLSLKNEDSISHLMNEINAFITEAFKAWESRSSNGVVHFQCIQELFSTLKFNLSKKLVNEIIQEIQNYSLNSETEPTGLTFEQFCILAADFKRFRSSTNVIKPNINKHSLSKSSSSINDEAKLKSATNKNIFKRSSSSPADRLGPEVFLGGSCNPTTWRADVAIPILQKLGISFYNPQVSEWTPDLIELEQKAKEKAKVLFFVMDSQTRAAAGSIEAAHIAAQNPRQLVLVLHPYKLNQQIFKETISSQEYYDLQRNQQILKEMVTRRGLFVLEDISSGLERTKEIVTGARESSSNVRTVLNVVWRAFTRVLNLNERSITIQQCEKALRSLGYTQSLLTTLNLTQVIFLSQQYKHKSQLKKMFTKQFQIYFEDFCVISAYFSILQQEVYDSGCTSPIKGMIAPHPPIYLANVQEEFHHQRSESLIGVSTKSLSRRNSCNSMPNINVSRSEFRNTCDINVYSKILLENNQLESNVSETNRDFEMAAAVRTTATNVTQMNTVPTSLTWNGRNISESKDVYLGGSCYLRTKWRNLVAIPFLESQGLTYHLPLLHESIPSNSKDGHCTVQWQNLYNPVVLDSSNVLFFYISNETRSLAPMTLAAHCIGLMYNVVLCIQMLPDQCIIGNELLTRTAVKDYNRGRSYLLDLAKSLNVPVFDDLQPALECVVQRVKNSNLCK